MVLFDPLSALLATTPFGPNDPTAEEIAALEAWCENGLNPTQIHLLHRRRRLLETAHSVVSKVAMPVAHAIAKPRGVALRICFVRADVPPRRPCRPVLQAAGRKAERPGGRAAETGLAGPAEELHVTTER